MANKPPLTVRSVSKGLKTASQLIADSTRSVVEEVMPNMSSTWFSLQTEASNTVNKALAKTNSVINRQHSLVARTKLGRSIQTSVNKMAQQMGLADYEGNQLAFELENYSQDFDSDSFTEGADGSGSFENGYGTTENMKALSVMNRNLAANGLATVKSVNNMTKTLANVNLESTKAISSTIENMSIAQTNAISSGMSEVVRQIQITNNYTAAMLDFMNQNISPSNSNLVDTMSIIGAKLDEISESLKTTGKSIDRGSNEEPSHMDRFFSDGSGFNVKEYKKAIKEAFNETSAGQTLGMLTNALSTFKGSVKSKGVIRGTASITASPLLKTFLSGAIGGVDTKAMLAEADNSLSKVMKAWMYRLGDMADDMNANNFQQIIGRLFGVKRTKIKGLDMSAGRKDEVIGWNGVAQTALTQVIPNYLASIEKAISGSSEKKLYDYESGTFKGETELLNDLVKKVVEMNDTAFAETTSKIIKALEVQGSSKQDTNELLNAINNIVNVRINEGRGQDAEYQAAIEAAMTKAGLGTVAQGRIKSELEESIETMTKSLNTLYERISNESTDHLAYRNIFNNYDKTQRALADRFLKANKTFINPGMFNSMASWEYEYEPTAQAKFQQELFNAIQATGYIDPSKTNEIFGFLGKGAKALANAGYSTLVSKGTRKVARTRSAQDRQEYQDELNTREAEISTASSQADKFEESSEKSLGTNISLDGKMSESKRRSENVKIGEAISSGNTNSILQGLVMSLHNNLIMPMYTDVFSENGMLNKFFGGEDSEWSKLKDKLFGKENGILTPMVDYLKYQFTGKGYISRSGKIYEDKEENIWNTIKELYGKGYGDSMTYLFGDEYTQNETYQKFFHFLSPEGIKETKNKIDDYKKKAKLEASYIAKFRDMKDKVLANELHIDDYTKDMGDIVIDNSGKTHAKGLFKDLIENLEEEASKRVLERIDRYNKELVEAGYLDSKRYGKLGEGAKFVKNFMNSQNDPRWAGIPTGIRSDGSIATMGSSGCGIMSLVYNANARGNMITPMEALRYAQTNGGLTEGQANGNLYTSLGGKQTSARKAFAAVARGNSAILAGRGLGTGSNGDHIISLLGMNGNSATILDPTYGIPQVVSLDKLRGTKTAFVFGDKSPLGGGLNTRNSTILESYRSKMSAEDFRSLVLLLGDKGISTQGTDEIQFGNGDIENVKNRLTKHGIKYSTKEAKNGFVNLLLDKVAETHTPVKGDKYQILNEIKTHIADIKNAIQLRKDGESVFSDMYKLLNGNSGKDKKDSVTKSVNDMVTILRTLLKTGFGIDVNGKLNGNGVIKPGTTNYIIKRDGNRNVVIVPTESIKNASPDSFEIKPSTIEDLAIESANINVATATINISDTQLRSIFNATTTKPIDGNVEEEIEPDDDVEYDYGFDEDGVQIVREKKKEKEEDIERLIEEAYKNKEGFADSIKDLEQYYASAAENAQKLDEITGEAVGEPEDFRKTFMRDLKSYNKKFKGLPKTLTKGAIIGGAIGALNMTGAGLLTSLFLPTSLVGGAIAGCGLSLLSKSEKFNNYLFGEKDETGARVGGLINKSQIASFKKVMPYAVGGATLGIVKNIVGGALGMNIGVPGILGGALLGSNPIGAGIVGLGLGILKNSETFKKTLFGDKGDDGKHSGGFLSKGLDKMTEIVKETSQYTKGGLKGALIGAGAGLTLSNMGFIPAALGLGGPIGAAIAGLGIGIASNSDRFKRFLFGDEYIDAEGKEGRRKNGLIHRAMNKIMDEVVYPVKGMFQDNVEDFAIWAKKHLVLPFKLTFGPIIDSFSTFKDDLKKTIHDAFETLTDGITGILRGGLEKLLTPLTATVRGVAGLSMKAVKFGAKMTGTMASVPLHLVAWKTHKKRKREDAAYKNAVFDNIEDKWALDDASGKYNTRFGWAKRGWDHFKDFAGFGSFADDDMNVAAREAWAQGMEGNGRNALGWFEAGAKLKRDVNKYKSDKKKRESFREAEKLMKKWKREDDHIEDRGWTDELLDERAKALRKLGLVKEGVNTEEDIKQLMYHRGEWQKRFGAYGTEKLEVKEAMTREQQAQEETSLYQKDMIARADRLIDILSGKSAAHTADELTAKSERTRVSSNLHYFTKFGLNEQDIENINRFTQGRIELSKNTIKKFKDYTDAYRSTNPDREFFMSRSTYDDIFEDERKSGMMKGYADNLKEQEAIKKEKERIENIDNSLLFASLMNKGLITEEVYNTLRDEYKNADLSHTQIKELALQKTLENIKNQPGWDQHLRVVDEIDGIKYVQESVVDDYGKLGWVGSQIAQEMSNDYTNNKNKQVRSEDWEEWLSNIISNAMIDAEEVIQEEEDRQEREKAQSEHAQKGDLTKRYADMELKWYEKFFTKEDGTRNWAGKSVDKVKNSWLGKLIGGLGSFGSLVADSPLLQVGLLTGAYIFREQIGPIVKGTIDVAKDVAVKYIPGALNFIGQTVVPFIFDNISNIASFAIRSIPEIGRGIWDGMKYLWQDVRSWMGLGGQKTSTYTSDQVNTATGMTHDGKTLAQHNGKYILDENGNYQVLDDYQFIDDEGDIRNIDRGSAYKIAKFSINALKNPMNLAGGTRFVGGSVRAVSAIGKRIPIVNNVFRLTDAMGSKMMDGGKAMKKYVKDKRAETGKRHSMCGLIADAMEKKRNAYDAEKLAKQAAEEAEIMSKNMAKANSEFLSYATKSSDSILNSGMKSDAAIELFDLVREFGSESKEVNEYLSKGLKPGKRGYNKRLKAKRKEASAIIDYATQVGKIAEANSIDAADLSSKASKALNKTLKEATTDGLDDIFKTVAKSSDDIIEGGSKAAVKGKLKWLFNMIGKAKSLLCKIFDGTLVSDILKRLTHMGDDFLKKASNKVLTSTLGKFAEGAMRSMDDWIPVVNVVFTIGDAVKGWANTENLFGVPEGYADGTMKAISTFINTILGLGVGPLFDIFLTMYSSVTGRNMKKEFAEWIYTYICEATGNNKALNALGEAQSIMEQELERYNLDHKGGELTMNEYLELKEQEDNIVNNVKKFFGSKDAIDTSKYEVKYGKDAEGNIVISSTNTTVDTQALLNSLNQINTNISAAAVLLSDGMSDSIDDLAVSVEGYGRGAIGYGNSFSQSDPSWAKFTLGKFPNGQPATMDLAGCGPTALANVASQMSNSYSPIEVAQMAKTHGYITDGGANARLFDEGANKLGLNSKKIDKNNIIRHLSNGEKIIVSGKTNSAGYGNLFTPAGHIVTLEGKNGNAVIVNDPQNGSISMRRMSELSPFITNAWAFNNEPIGFSNKIRSRFIMPLGYGNLGERPTNAYYADNENGTYDDYVRWAKDMRDGVKPPSSKPKFGDPNYGYYVYYNRLRNNDHRKTADTIIKEKNAFRTLSAHRDVYNTVKHAWDSLSDFDKDQIYIEWANNGNNIFDYFMAVSDELYDLASKGTTDMGIVNSMLEFDILPTYYNSLPKDHKRYLTVDEIVKINNYHGYYNADASIYNQASLKESIDKTYSKEVELYLSAIKKDPYNFNIYSNIPMNILPLLADKSAGGDPSLMDNYIYRLINAQFNANKSMSVSEYNTAMAMISNAITNGMGATPEYFLREHMLYGIVNRIPFYSIYHDLWNALQWGGSEFSANGGEIASLASILTAYNLYNGSGIAITPEHMMNNWFIPENSLWYNTYGIKDNFYTKIGLQSLKETFDSTNKPLKITKTNKRSDIIDAMKNRKLVLIYNEAGNTNLKYMFGDSRYVVGTYADDNYFTTVDPSKPNSVSYPLMALDEFPKSGLSAHIFETGDGGGLNISSNVDLFSPSLGQSTWDEIDKESNNGLGILSKIVKAFAAMGQNLLTMIIGNTAYESIFKEKMDDTVSGKEQKEVLDLYSYLNEATTEGYDRVAPTEMKDITESDSSKSKDPFNIGLKKTFGLFYDPLGLKSKTADLKVPEPTGMKGHSAYYAPKTVNNALANPNIPVISVGNTKQTTTSQGSALSIKPQSGFNGMPSNVPIYSKMNGYGKGYYGYGGEDDEATFDLNTTEGILGNVEYIFSKHLSKYLFGTDNTSGTTDSSSTKSAEVASANNSVYSPKSNPLAKIERGDGKSAIGLVAFAKSMMEVGCRYVWGGSCKKLTESYKNELQRKFGADRAKAGKANYYNEKYAIARDQYVSDCSGLIRGYTGKTYYTAASLYSGSKRKGKISNALASTLLKTPGLLVFRQSKTDATMVHVGILVGDGTVIDIADYIPSAASDVKIRTFSTKNWTHWGEASCLDYNILPSPVKEVPKIDVNLPKVTPNPTIDNTIRNGLSRGSQFTPVALIKGGESDILNTRMSVDQYVKSLGYGPGKEVDYLLNTLGGRITQRVGLGVDPSTGVLTRHRGTDIAALYNSPIHSPVSGTVIENKGESYGSDYGNYVVVKDARGKKHLIAHMNEASGYGVGSHINTGDILGFVGSSGKSTGPHVHYEIRERDHIIDPLEYGKVTRHTLGLNNKSKINMIERKLDETMTKHGSPVGGDDDFITTLNSALKSDSAEHIVDTLHEIVSILTGWSSMDADSKNRILDAMENVSENSNNLMNINSSNTTVNNANSNTVNRIDNNSKSTSHTREIESKSGRSLHDLIARKNALV